METIDILQEQTPAPARKGFSLGSIVLLMGLVAVSLVLGLQLYNQLQTQPEPGHPAPEFEVTTFDGGTFNLADYRGQVVIVNFWASWCAPCRDEAADLQHLHEDYKDDGVVLVGINWLDAEREALAFVDEFDITYINGTDIGERIARDYNIAGVPETFIIDQNGEVAAAFMLPVHYDELSRIIDTLLERDL